MQKNVIYVTYFNFNFKQFCCILPQNLFAAKNIFLQQKPCFLIFWLKLFLSANSIFLPANSIFLLAKSIFAAFCRENVFLPGRFIPWKKPFFFPLSGKKLRTLAAGDSGQIFLGGSIYAWMCTLVCYIS